MQKKYYIVSINVHATTVSLTFKKKQITNITWMNKYYINNIILQNNVLSSKIFLIICSNIIVIQ